MNRPSYARPEREQLERQSESLAPLRNKLLRQVQVATRQRIVDLGAGTGAVTGELVRRGAGQVLAVDSHPDFESLDPEPFAGAFRLRADAAKLPLQDASVDLVFCQLGLLWMDAPAVLDEVARILTPGGAFVSIEPDVGGLIEHPPERALKDLWIRGLRTAGADPEIGRKVPGLLAERGLAPTVEVFAQVGPAGRDRFAMLRGLPLAAEDAVRLATIAAMPQGKPWELFVWMPIFGVTARKPR